MNAITMVTRRRSSGSLRPPRSRPPPCRQHAGHAGHGLLEDELAAFRGMRPARRWPGPNTRMGPRPVRSPNPGTARDLLVFFPTLISVSFGRCRLLGIVGEPSADPHQDVVKTPRIRVRSRWRGPSEQRARVHPEGKDTWLAISGICPAALTQRRVRGREPETRSTLLTPAPPGSLVPRR